MDRVKTSRITFTLKWALALSIYGILIPCANSSRADVVFTKPETFSAIDQGDYPESHFGANPGFAVRAARSPAGLEAANANPNPATSDGTRIAQVSPNLIPTTDQNPSIDSASVAARKGVQEVAVIAGDLGFFPKTVFVSRDVPVRLFVTSASKNTLCIMMDSFQVRKQVRAQKIEEITFTPSTPGQYRFYCPVNGMEGTMIVKELASAPPAKE